MTTHFSPSPLWAILPTEADKVAQIYGKELDFYASPPKDLEDKFKCAIDISDEALFPSTYEIRDGVGVLPIMGMIIPKSNFFTLWFGGFAALDLLERDFRSLVAREDVHTIILDIDSAGGNAFGVQQFANIIFDSRNTKSIIAVTAGMMASAAMWIGAAASKVFITGDVTVVGSIGTVTTHTDISKLNERIGITQTEVAAGKYKRVPSALEPLTEEGRLILKGQVEHANEAFIFDIAKFRGVKPSAVNKMAEGRTFIGTQGIDVGLIDGLLPMGQLMDNVSNNREDTEVFVNNYKSDNNFNSLTGGIKMTLMEQIADLRSQNPDLYNAVVAKGKDEAKVEFDQTLTDSNTAEHTKGLEAGKEIGRTEGVEAERDRISGIRELSNADNADLIEKFIADGKTTAPEAAVEILKAQKVSNTSSLNELESSAPGAMGASVDGTETLETDDSKKGLKQLVAEYQLANKDASKGESIKACAKAFPNAKNDFREVVKIKKY